jgi:signal transduction histidine kinase
VNDLLEIARLEAGKTALTLAEVDVAELVRLVASHFDALAADAGTTFAVEAPPTLVHPADPDKLQRVLFNLVSNAFKFTPPGGRVRCTLRGGGEGGGFTIEVADSGPGIPEGERARVFARFERGRGDAPRHAGGTGLGLAIAKDFVELHGGRIDLGDAPEGGALFTVHVPPQAPSAKAARTAPGEGAEYGRGVVEELRVHGAPAPAPGDGSRPLVLVVEDNAEMSRFLAEILSADFEVTTAPDGAAGLASALERPPDAIVTDVMMPRMAGDRLVRALREERRLDGVPVLVLTARADDALRIELLRAGAQDYLMKPFVVEEVRARVANLVALKRVREALEGEVETRTRDVASLAVEVATRKRELEASLEATRLARAEAERVSAVKTQFLRLVSHELRTPLTSLNLQLQRFARDAEAPLSARQKDAVRRASFGVTRLTGLVEALLHEAQIASGRLAPEVEDVDVGELARGVVEELRPQAEDKGLALAVRADDHLPWAQTEPRFLRLILANLVGNGIKYTSSGGVEVAIEGRGDGLRVRVSDSGPGIAAADQARVFEPFERGAREVEGLVPGLGLGLAVVRDLAAAIGARVELRSIPGAGSTFVVVLPLRQPGRARGSAGRAPAGQPHRSGPSVDLGRGEA